MSKTRIYYLKPETTFRTELRSDTLWGTICWAIRNVYGNSELEKLISSYQINKPEFIISSEFPYKITDNKRVLFFPKPLIQESYINQSKLTRKEMIEKAKKRKKLKKIQFIDEKRYYDILSGKETLNKVLAEIVHAKEALKSPQIKSESVTHNKIDRIKGGSLKLDEGGQLFHVNEYYLDTSNENSGNMGFYFLARGNNEKLEGALRFLEHIGIGGDRNIGKGCFSISSENMILEEPLEHNAYTNLSLYIPSDDELKTYKGNSFFNYRLEDRQGYMGFFKHQNFDKPASLMFKEGSVFPAIEKDVFGNNPIVKHQSESQPFNVYQYGMGFMVKMKIA